MDLMSLVLTVLVERMRSETGDPTCRAAYSASGYLLRSASLSRGPIANRYRRQALDT